MIEDDDYKLESVVEQLIFILWLSVGISTVVGVVLALAL
jgi:hypothetical protein